MGQRDLDQGAEGHTKSLTNNTTYRSALLLLRFHVYLQHVCFSVYLRKKEESKEQRKAINISIYLPTQYKTIFYNINANSMYNLSDL